MTNVYFPEEEISTDDLYFVCYMIERTARQLRQPNKLSLADTFHSENPLAVSADWIDEYQLKSGDYNVADVQTSLCPQIPTATQMGKVYKRLIINTMQSGEDYSDAILRVYNNPICKVIDNYNTSAYYEPSPFIVRCYYAGGFL